VEEGTERHPAVDGPVNHSELDRRNEGWARGDRSRWCVYESELASVGAGAAWIWWRSDWELIFRGIETMGAALLG
jgi:hypothetical protein